MFNLKGRYKNMKTKNKYFSIIASVALMFTLLITGSVLMLKPEQNANTAYAYEVPATNGSWLTEIENELPKDGNGNINFPLAYQYLSQKSYNHGRNGSTKESAFIIMNSLDLAFLSWLTYNGRGETNTYFHYILGADIDLTGKEWQPIGGIGRLGNLNVEYRFYGALHGTRYVGGVAQGNYKIINLSIVESNDQYEGLIGFSQGINQFSDLTFENAYVSGSRDYYGLLLARSMNALIIDNVTFNDGYLYSSTQGNAYIGALAGYVQPNGQQVSIQNVTNNAEVFTVGNYASGIISYIDENGNTSADTASTQNYVLFNNVINNGTITGTTYVAGLVSRLEYANVYDSYNTGNIYSSIVIDGRTAGLFGLAYYSINIENSYNTGNIEGYSVAGIISQIATVVDNSQITNTYNNGILNGYRVGGLMAIYGNWGANPNNTSTLSVENFYNTGEIVSLEHVGGVIAYVNGSVTFDNVYNTVDIISESGSGYSGGLIGYKYYWGLITINNSYNTGNIITPLKTYVGGLVGYTENLTTSGATVYDYNSGLIIRKSYNLGDLEGRNIGGLVGYVRVYMLIEESFNMGKIIAGETYAGGLIGYAVIYFNGLQNEMGIYNSYNTGEISAGVSYNGGLVGRVEFSNQSTGGVSNKTFDVVNSFNAALVQTATNTYGLVAYITFTNVLTIVQEVNFENSFSLNNVGEDDLANALKLYHDNPSFLNGVERVITTDYSSQVIGEGDDAYTVYSGSRILSEQELRNINIYQAAGYDFLNTWAMPTEGSQGNNGAPYLQQVSGIEVTLVLPNQNETYNGVMLEPLNITRMSAGKTFTGWSTRATSQEEGYVFYPAGSVITLGNTDTTLYAQFVTTSYFNIIIDAPSSGSLSAQVAITADSNSYNNGIAIKEDNNSYIISLTNLLDSTMFEGWQVYRPSTNTWYTLTTKYTLTLSLKERVNENFVQQFARYYAVSQIDGDYTIVGEFRFRASKNANPVQVSATSSTGNLGLLKVNNQDAPLSGVVFTTINEGAAILLQANPNNYYTVSGFTVTYTLSGNPEPVINNLPAINNQASFNLGIAGETITHMIIHVDFEKIVYEFNYTVQTKDVTDYNLSGLNVITVNSQTDLRIEESTNISLLAQDTEVLFANARIKFVGFKIFNYDTNEYDYIFNANNLMFELNTIIESDFLNKYANNNEFVVIAEYAVEYYVNITNQVGGNLEINIQPENVDMLPQTFTNTVAGYFEKDSTISMFATPSSYYAFNSFGGSYTGTTNGTNLNITLSEPTSVVANYTLQIYTLTFELKDEKTNTAISDGQINAQLNEVSVTTVKAGDIITLNSVVVPQGYKFGYFQIKNGSSLLNNLEDGEEIEIDDTFLLQYLTINNRIVIIGRYVRQIVVSVNIASNQTNMGSYELRVKQGENYVATTERTFDVGTEIEIEAFVNPHHLFTNFINVFDLEKVSDTNKVRITLSGSNRNINLEFEKIVYESNKEDEKVASGDLSISKDEYTVGDQIVIMFKPESGQVVKKWTINGIEVRKIANATINSNSVTLTITEDWLNTFGGDLNNVIETGANPTILYATIGVSALIVILGATFVIFFIKNAKLKVAVKSELKQKEMSKYKMDTSSFIRDLREGKDVGQVTDEQVKEEIKRRKKDKK